MIRAVLAVVLSAALLSVALPAAERAEMGRNTELATAELERVAATADRLSAEHDPVDPAATPAGTTIVLEVPSSTFTESGKIRIDEDGLRWVAPAGHNRTVVPDPRLHVETPIVASRRVRLRLSLVRLDGDRVVRIHRIPIV